MQKKEKADWVFFNVSFENNNHEAIAIYRGKVIDMGSIPYIFNNYRGFKDFNAQGNPITQLNKKSIQIGTTADGIVVYLQANKVEEKYFIWQIEGNQCFTKHTELLDPHWDDH